MNPTELALVEDLMAQEEDPGYDVMQTVEEQFGDGEVENTGDDENREDFDIVQFCQDSIARCSGEETSQSDFLNTANDLYFGRLPGKDSCETDPHRSDWVSMDVQDSIEATMAQVMPAFEDDDLGLFQAFGPEDEEQARLESKVVNHTLFEECPGWVELYQAVKDAMQYRSGIIKVYWDVRYVPFYEYHEGIPSMAAQELTQPQEEGEVVDIIGGEQVGPDTYNIKIRRTRTVSKPVVESIPPEEVLVLSDHPSPLLQQCKFVAHEKTETQSSLIEQGFDPEVVKSLGSHIVGAGDNDDVKRTRRSDSTVLPNDSTDESAREIRVYECYPVVDADGDGIAERLRVIIADNVLLSQEEMDYSPLISGTGIIVPHRHQGLSLTERQTEIQYSKSKLMRSIINGTSLAANQRIGAVGNRVNLDDLISSRTGGIVRMRSADAVVPIPNPEIPQSAFQVLGLLDTSRRERGGSAIDNNGQNMQIGGDSAHGVERIMSAAEQTNALYAKTIAETLVKEVYLALHKLLRKYHRGTLPLKVGGKWTSCMPEQWPERNKVKVIVGKSHGERLRMAAAIGQTFQIQMSMAGQGFQGTMVTEENMYNALIDSVRLNGLPSPERYFTSPHSETYQQAQQQMQQQQMEQQQMEQEMQQMQMELQQQIADAEMSKAQAANNKANYDAKINQMKIQLDAAVKAAKQASDDENLVLDWAKLFSDISLKLTEIEATSETEQNANYEQNMRTASGGQRQTTI